MTHNANDFDCCWMTVSLVERFNDNDDYLLRLSAISVSVTVTVCFSFHLISLLCMPLSVPALYINVCSISMLLSRPSVCLSVCLSLCPALQSSYLVHEHT